MLVERVRSTYILWQQLSCILSAVTTGWQKALLNACLESAISQTCAASIAHEFRSPPSDDSACRCLNTKNAAKSRKFSKYPFTKYLFMSPRNIEVGNKSTMITGINFSGLSR